MHREAGFTLLETLVALAVLGVVLATLFRLAGDSLVRQQGREAQLRLALTAEAAFNLARLGDPAPASPVDLSVTVARQDLSAALDGDSLALPEAAVDDNLEWLTVTVTDETGRSFELGGAVARLRR
jgi:prepilin-type N-terminal cleavage/methylation domain-containing protein